MSKLELISIDELKKLILSKNNKIAFINSYSFLKSSDRSFSSTFVKNDLKYIIFYGYLEYIYSYLFENNLLKNKYFFSIGLPFNKFESNIQIINSIIRNKINIVLLSIVYLEHLEFFINLFKKILNKNSILIISGLAAKNLYVFYKEKALKLSNELNKRNIKLIFNLNKIKDLNFKIKNYYLYSENLVNSINESDIFLYSIASANFCVKKEKYRSCLFCNSKYSEPIKEIYTIKDCSNILNKIKRCKKNKLIIKIPTAGPSIHYIYRFFKFINYDYLKDNNIYLSFFYTMQNNDIEYIKKIRSRFDFSNYERRVHLIIGLEHLLDSVRKDFNKDYLKIKEFFKIFEFLLKNTEFNLILTYILECRDYSEREYLEYKKNILKFLNILKKYKNRKVLLDITNSICLDNQLFNNWTEYPSFNRFKFVKRDIDLFYSCCSDDRYLIFKEIIDKFSRENNNIKVVYNDYSIYDR